MPTQIKVRPTEAQVNALQIEPAKHPLAEKFGSNSTQQKGFGKHATPNSKPTN